MRSQIEYNSCASSTKAFAIIAEGWNDLVQEGFTPDLQGTCPVKDDSEVLFATSSDGDIVGVLTWTRDPIARTFTITLGYVEPSSRRQHVFTEMFQALWEIADKSQATDIKCPIHADNTPARAVLSRLKAKPVAVEYVMRVS